MRRKSAKDFQIAAFADDQYGVVSRAQLLQAGLSREDVDRRMQAGRLIALYRGVYAVGHRALKVEGRWMAAVLAAGDGAVLSHRAAAALWDLCAVPHGAIHVTVSGDGGRKRRPGMKVHRSATLTPAETTVHRGIPVTTATRTIIDLARTLRGRPLEALIDSADFHGLVDFRDLRATNSSSLNAVLQNYRPAPTQSELEEAFLRLCDDHDIPRPETGGRVEGYTVDFVWRDLGLAVEVDGYRYHRAPHKFESDGERDVTLTTAGWRVLRFTWRQLTERTGWVAETVRACVRELRPASRTPAGRSRRRTGTGA